MDPSLYRAAVEGNTNVLVQNQDDQVEVGGQVTPNKNTVLHVATLFGHTHCVTEILKACPSLVCKVNSRGETPLYIAAREGHSSIVQVLIEEYAKTLDAEPGAVGEMLRMTNEDGDTALHEAVRNYYPEVVRLLLTAGDPEFSHPANKAEETPLYLAAEGGYVDLVSAILEACRSPAHGGPGGRSALHGAVISNNQECTKKILDWKQSLTAEVDLYGWTPLHYAVRCKYPSIVRQLLDVNKSVAYLADKDEKNIALHIAASQGDVKIMEELITHSPDCWEMVNGRGRNVLHIAVVNGHNELIDFIVKDSMLSRLINQKDAEGNTPLHLLAASKHYVASFVWHPTVHRNAFNKENLTPLDVVKATSAHHTKGDLIKFGAVPGRRNIAQKKAETEDEHEDAVVPRDVRQIGDTHLIVATLIATVTFAAGFTLPGGYNGNDGPNQGMAILTREAAFKAFVITDTIALICSISAIFIYFVATDYEEVDKLMEQYMVAIIFIVVAMGAMVIAFITGLYAVLEHSSGLATTVCVIGSLALLIFYIVLRKACRRRS